MKNNGISYPLRRLLSAAASLAAGLSAGFVLMVFIAWKQQGSLAAGLSAAFHGGLLPLLTAGWKNGVDSLLSSAAAVMLLGLSVSFAWQGGLWQLGGPGFFALGALGAFFGFSLGLPWYVCFVFACAAGALGGVIPGLIKSKGRMHEGYATALMNWLCLWSVQAIGKSSPFPEISPLPPRWLGWGGALALCLLLMVFLKCTLPGFEIHLLGRDASVARWAGVKEGKKALLILTVSGMLAGAAGGWQLISGQLTALPGPAFALTGLGLHGLAAAALALGHPALTCAAALLVTLLSSGAGALDQNLFPPETGEGIIALILFFASILRVSAHFMREGRDKA